MKRCNLTLSLIFLSFLAHFASSVSAEELLIPVRGQELQVVLEKNRYFVEKYRYFAKRHRIVKLQIDALLADSGEVEISPFSDVTIPLVRRKLNMYDENLGFEWQGYYSEVPITRESYTATQISAGIDRNIADQLYEDIFGVRVFGALYINDPESSYSVSMSGMRKDISTGRFVSESDRLARSENGDQPTFYAIDIDLRPPGGANAKSQSSSNPFPEEYEIRSLPMDRQYHIVYELDAKKALPKGRFDPSRYPDQANKVTEYREFLKALGEDPRKKAIGAGGEQ